MDEDGNGRNYPTRQARDFDRGFDLPGLPMPPVRLTAGYFLDPAATVIERTQIARPIARRRTLWCAAIVPIKDREIGQPTWIDITRQATL